MLVDYGLNDPDEGIITNVERTAIAGFYNIKVKVEREDNVISTNWPHAMVRFCGRLLPKRQCNNESRDPKEGSMFK